MDTPNQKIGFILKKIADYKKVEITDPVIQKILDGKGDFDEVNENLDKICKLLNIDTKIAAITFINLILKGG